MLVTAAPLGAVVDTPANRAALIEEPVSTQGAAAPETPDEVLIDVAPDVAPDDAPELVEVDSLEPEAEQALPVGEESPEGVSTTESDDTTANA